MRIDLPEDIYIDIDIDPTDRAITYTKIYDLLVDDGVDQDMMEHIIQLGIDHLSDEDRAQITAAYKKRWGLK